MADDDADPSPCVAYEVVVPDEAPDCADAALSASDVTLISVAFKSSVA